MGNNKNTGICCIGHITLDKVVTPEFEVYMPGGTAYYFAKALRNLDHRNFRLLTSLGESEYGVVEELRKEGIDVTVVPSKKSVFFENIYGHDRNNRVQKVRAKADPFMPEKVDSVDAAICHLGTLLADDFDTDTIKKLASKGMVSLDIQGFLREVIGEDVVHVDYEMKQEIMPYIHTLKANETEMEVLTGCCDPRQAAKVLAEWGCKEIVLTFGDKGSLIYAEGKFFEIPAIPPAKIVDATGCGDTYMAGYLYKRSMGEGYEEAGRFAAAMCTLKLTASGPFSGTEEDILKVQTSCNK